MESPTTKLALPHLGTETNAQLFEDWFDPIESGVRGRIRDFIESMIEAELEEALSRPRYGRRILVEARLPCRAHARARGEFWPISGSVFGASTKNRSSLEASLGFAAIIGTPRTENGGTFAVDFADGMRDRHHFYVRPDAP